MNCLVCTNKSTELFRGTMLGKYQVLYYRCSNCGLIQTETPYWLNEAYQKAITATDIGLVGRNLHLSNVVYRLILNTLDHSKKFLDYGGGYGLLVRLLRDKGLDFYRQDIYCENLFALHHDLEDLAPADRNFGLITCFEVFEHTPEPYALLEKLKSFSDKVLISTMLVPPGDFRQTADWWYFAPDTGQHVTFYTLRSLELLARQHGFNLYSDGVSLHLFTRVKLKTNPLSLKNSLWIKLAARLATYILPSEKKIPSLVSKDVETARQKAARLMATKTQHDQ